MTENIIMEKVNFLKRGLSGFDLKILALALMLLDHIHYFFSFTEKVPVLFSQLGRLSGGLFLFMIIEGFTHTSNRKKYFKRIYLFSVFMGVIQYVIIYCGLSRPDGFWPQNNIYASFILVLLIIQGIEWMKEKKWKRGLLILSVAIVPNLLSFFVPMKFMPVLGLLMTTVLPLPMFVEGGIFFVISGVLLYVFRSNRKVQAGVFIVFTLSWTLGMALLMAPDLSITTLFTKYYEWMGAFAGLLMLLYNEERGRKAKQLFYVFYPAHVYILYILSWLVFTWMK